MAGPTLGTLLIQRLDAALGTTLSQQTQIVNRATSDPVTHPDQTARPTPVTNSLVRHPKESVDRALLTHGKNTRIDTPKRPSDTLGTQQETSARTSSATTALGSAARIILALFANYSPEPRPAIGRFPLFSNAPNHADTPAETDTKHTASTSARSASNVAPNTGINTNLSRTLAHALAQNLQQSGLFYESHLARVSVGTYRLSDMRHEPQAQIPTATNRTIQSTIVTPGVDSATHPIVRQQLESLADQTVHWRGEAWPGAPMDWQIRRQQEHHHQTTHDVSVNPPWQSHLRIQLLHLGQISAAIRLNGNQVYVDLQASQDAIAELQAHRHDLHSQMSWRGLDLRAVQIAPDDGDNVMPEHSAPSHDNDNPGI